jgi:uncharacterized protein
MGKKMARPHKCRKVFSNPEVVHFKPAGVMMQELEEICLTLDEFEAIRLADYDRLYHEEAARKMNVSRQTFGNIINSAHRKIADFLINTKSLRINGGVVEMNESEDRHFICYDCKHKWGVAFGTTKPGKCPQCGSNNLHRLPAERGRNRLGKRTGNCIKEQ